jgi:cell division protein FtsZ
VARLGKQQGAVVVAIVTLPFSFEGGARAALAESSLLHLQEEAHTVIVIPNDRILEYAGGSLAFFETSELADQLSAQIVRSIGQLASDCGLINVDLADIQQILGRSQVAFVGSGAGQGFGRARQAVEKALACELLGTSADNATDLLLNVSGGFDLTLTDVEQAATAVRERIAPDARIIIGTTIEPGLSDEVRVTLLATGGDNVFPPPGSRGRPRRERQEVVFSARTGQPLPAASGRTYPYAVSWP